jgi:glycolate oxidase iron-sulfur subunit
VQTTLDQLQSDSDSQVSAGVIRRCVHCGFCTATCPTYVLLGDELDSPRGRIYLMKEMLEQQAKPRAEVVKHIDRCLSCLSCESTCPSGVSYRRLVDHARAYIEDNYRRPLGDRALREMLARVLPYRRRFAAALGLARLFRPLRGLIGRVPAFRPLAEMLEMAKPVPASAAPEPRLAEPRMKVAFLEGCVEPVIGAHIQAAARRLLARQGCEVVPVAGIGCCGALLHHLGRDEQALHMARTNVDRWWKALQTGEIESIVVTASGCGTVLRDYGHMLREDPTYAERAESVSARVRDISELVSELRLPEPLPGRRLRVVYHPPCSLQHGQRIRLAPPGLLAAAGFEVSLPAEAHLCCGSAGTYNILQPEIATRLGERKAAAIGLLAPDVVATGNIGCIKQIERYAGTPVVHTVELLDWATGGPLPPALAERNAAVAAT